MGKRGEKLLRYVKEGELPKVKVHLKKHKRLDVNAARDTDGRTPLHLACLVSDDAIIRCLLKFGADASIQDLHGNTALHLTLFNVLNGNKYAYSDIAMLLMTLFPKSLTIRNKKGISPKKLLKKVKEKLKAWEKEEEEEEKRRQEREEEMKWNKRLAEEMEDDVTSSWFHDERYSHEHETYDEWADRISEQYHRKHHKRKSNSEDNDRRKRQREQQQQQFQQQLEKEHEEYKRRSSKRIQEQRLQKKRDYDRKCGSFFSTRITCKIFYKDVPWPGSQDDVQEMIKILLSDVEKSDDKAYKKYIRSQQILWHPDKFQQKVGQYLHELDKERILNKVTEISQALNNLSESS